VRYYHKTKKTHMWGEGTVTRVEKTPGRVNGGGRGTPTPTTTPLGGNSHAREESSGTSVTQCGPKSIPKKAWEKKTKNAFWGGSIRGGRKNSMGQGSSKKSKGGGGKNKATPPCGEVGGTYATKKD